MTLSRRLSHDESKRSRRKRRSVNYEFRSSSRRPLPRRMRLDWGTVRISKSNGVCCVTTTSSRPSNPQQWDNPSKGVPRGQLCANWPRSALFRAVSHIMRTNCRNLANRSPGLRMEIMRFHK
ncbi:hypothetical protein MTP99_016265 [Tenebrio molitor]|nr:hypothetical protein MTP99_016265 [Tenebrio molitor]